MSKCSICSKEYNGHGHNAIPINSGRCCDNCNGVVIKARMLQIINENKKGVENE